MIDPLGLGGGHKTLLDPAGIFGKRPGARVDPLAGISLQTSCYGGALPLVYGTTRVAANIVDYDDFTCIPRTTNVGKGGGTTQTTYTYTVGGILALCEGTISSINRVWMDKTTTTLTAQGWTLKTGTRPQTPWAVWTTKHPNKALAYSGMAYVCAAAFNLGTGGQMSNNSFEITALLATEADTNSLISLGTGDGTTKNFQLLDASGAPITDMSGYVGPVYYVASIKQTTGFTVGLIGGTYYLQFTVAPTTGQAVAWGTSLVMMDAKPSAIVVDFLTDANHGAGWSAARIADLVTGAASYATYCQAMGFAVSPAFDSQKAAASHLGDLLEATNSEAVWTAGASGMSLKIVPYGDSPITANGTTYTPNTTPIYDLGVDDFIVSGPEEDPVTAYRTSVADTYNTIPVEFLDRMSGYNTSTVNDPEPVDVSVNGMRTGGGVSLHMITRRAHALAISRIMAQKSVYLRNSYKFKVGWKYLLLEPMDLVTLTENKLGLNHLVVRIKSINFPDSSSEEGGIEIEAEAWPFGTGTPTLYSSQAGAPKQINTAANPGNANAPVFVDVPPQFSASGGPEILIATAGGPMWGGCQVWASADGSTYTQIGNIVKPCRYGTLSANMLSSGGASVDLTASAGSVGSVPTSVATDLQSLWWIGGEIVSSSTATLTSAYHYDLTLPVRGAYGTAAAAHLSGVTALRVDDAVFRYAIPPSRLGALIYIKLVSFNLWGGGIQDISTLSASTYTPTSQGTYANQIGNNTNQTVIQINSADYLTNLDKLILMQQWVQEKSTQTSLDAQAVASLGASTAAQTNYDNAILAIDTYLGTTLGFSTWKTTWPDGVVVNVIGILTTLRGLWNTVASTRAILQNAIGAVGLQALATASTNAPAVGLLAARPTLPNVAFPVGTFFYATNDTSADGSAGTLWKNVGGVWTIQTGSVLTAGRIVAANITAGAIGAAALAANITMTTVLMSTGALKAANMTTANVQVIAASFKFIRASGSFVTDGFAVGQTITTKGFTNAGNNGNFIISSIATTTIANDTLVCSTAIGLVDETSAAGRSIFAAPYGFYLNGSPFTSQLQDGTTFSANMEIGSGINLGGFRMDALSMGRLLNGGSLAWSTPGTYYWTCPSGITQVEVTCVGGGGGGFSSGAASKAGGGGGGSVLAVVQVTPGAIYTIVVGSGGAGGTSGSSGAAGTLSSITGSGVAITCNPGGAGLNTGVAGASGSVAFQGSTICASVLGFNGVSGNAAASNSYSGILFSYASSGGGGGGNNGTSASSSTGVSCWVAGERGGASAMSNGLGLASTQLTSGIGAGGGTGSGAFTFGHNGGPGYVRVRF